MAFLGSVPSTPSNSPSSWPNPTVHQPCEDEKKNIDELATFAT